MLKKLILTVFGLWMAVSLTAQETYREVKPVNQNLVYQGKPFYVTRIFPQKFKSQKPKNIILMIGDGMGVADVFAGITANGGSLFLENCKHVGFSKTHSADNYITDSAAGGTAPRRRPARSTPWSAARATARIPAPPPANR